MIRRILSIALPRGQQRQNHLLGLALWVSTSLVLTGSAAAAPPSATDKWPAAVSALEAQSETVEGAATDDAAQQETVERQLRSLIEAAGALQSDIAGPIQQIQQRISQLGEGASESQDATLKAQAKALDDELRSLQDLDRRIGLVTLSAQQDLQSLTQAQVTHLSQQLLSRGPSPLSKDLWKPAIEFAPQIVKSTLREDRSQQKPRSSRGGAAALTLLWLGLLCLVAWASEALRRLVSSRIRNAPAASQPFALTVLGLLTLLTTIAPMAVGVITLDGVLAKWSLPTEVSTAISAVGAGIFFAAFVAALARATLQPANEDQRFITFSGLGTVHLWRSALLIGASMGVNLTCEQLITRLSLDPEVTLSVRAFTGFISVSAVLVALLALRRRSRSAEAAEGQSEGADPVTLVIGATWAVTLFILLSGAFGYILLANWVIQWAIWASVVVMSTWFAMTVVDRTIRYALEVRPARIGSRPEVSRSIRQASVVISALLRTVVILLAGGALFMPFGAGFTSVLELAGTVAAGVQIGEIRISAGSVLTGIIVFTVAGFLMRMLKSWLENSYLPTTKLAADARESVTTIVGYLGTFIAVLWALAAIGVGVDKLAILASALSVGIGFGLQAITQNFVSGLILLVERPIKLGDRIKVGDLDGTVRRVSVRSTEIRLTDQSLLIIPNSELITKPVQNISPRYARPKLELRVVVVAGEDIQQVLMAIKSAVAEDDDVAASPASEAVLHSIDGDKAALNCEVNLNPRSDIAQVRMRLILSIRRELATLGISSSIS